MLLRFSARGLLLILMTSVALLSAQPAKAEPEASDPPGRRVYVPIEDLDVIVEHDKQGVILSRDEFLKLSAEAKKQLAETPNSPRQMIVSEAQYAARIQDDQLVISAVIQLNQLSRGWQSVTLPYRGLAVEGATLDGKPAKIGRATGDGRPLVVLTEQTGRHTLKLEFSSPLVTVGSDKVAAFGLAPVASATLQLLLPAGKYLHIDDVPLERPAAADQPTTYSVSVGGKNALALRITDRRAQHDSASLVFAGTSIGLHVAPEERTWMAVTSLHVYGKSIDTLAFVVPKSLDIISVESTGLERWEIGEGPGGTTTTLKLSYRQAFDESRTITFTGVSASVMGQPWSVPTLSLTSAASHLVRVLVQYPPALRLQQVEATGVRRVSDDEIETPDMPGNPVMAIKVGANQMLHYAAWREDFGLQFVTQPRARELQATIATRIDINSQALALHASIAVQSRFAALFDFDLSIPVDWNVTNVLVENRPTAWRVVPVAAGLNQVRVSFDPPIPADGKITLILAARWIPGENWPLEDLPLSFRLPEVSLPQVGVTDGRYMIAAEDDIDLTPEEVTGLDPVRLSNEEQNVAGAPRLTYEYQDTRFTGTLKVSRKPVRVAAQTVAYHRLDRETLVSHLDARLVIQGGGLQKLQVALPESTGTNLRFSLVDPPNAALDRQPRITEQTTTVTDGQRVWTLSLDQRAFGLLWLVVDLTAPRAADKTSFDLPALRVLSADRQSGFIAIEGGPDQELSVTATDAAGQPLSEVDPADIPVALGYAPRERIIAAYRTVRPGVRLSLKETRFDRMPVPTAVCDRASLTSVLGKSGQQQHKAEFVLRAVGVQSLRVELSADSSARLWAALIDGRPIEIRMLEAAADGAAAWAIPLPSTSDAGRAIMVQLFYQTDGRSLETSGTFVQKPPRILAISGEGETQPIEILDREWTLHYPEATEITSSTGQFEPIEKPTRVSFLGHLHHSLALASPSELWQKTFFVAIFGAAIWIFFFVYRRRGVAAALLTGVVGLILAIVSTAFTLSSGDGARFEYAKVPATRLVMGSAPTSMVRHNAELHDESFESSSAMSADAKPEAPATAKESTKKPLAMQPAAGEGFSKGGGGMGGGMGHSMNGQKQSGRKPSVEKAHKDQTEMASTLGQPLPPGEEISGAMADPTVRSFTQQLHDDVSRTDAEFKAEIVANPPPPRNGTPVAASDSKGALLSLAIDLPVASGSRQTTFRYTGDPAATANPTLEVEYQNRRTLSFVSIAWQAGVLFVFWFARRWSAGVRAALGVTGLLAPLALVSIVPLEMLPYLDGLFLGSLWGVTLWIILFNVARFRESSATVRAVMTRRIAGFVVLSTCSLAPDALQAQKTNQQSRPAPTIIVPYEPGQDPVQAARVFLPWEEFIRLYDAAHPEKAVETPLPTAGLVTEALYAMQLSTPAAGKKPTVEVRGRFVFHSFRDDQITLPLPLGRVALTQAQLDGKAAAIVTGESGSEVVMAAGARGMHVLDIRFSLPVELTGAAGKFTIPTQAVASGLLRFTLPADDLILRVTGGAGAFRKVREENKTIAIVPIDLGGDVSLSWTLAQTREITQGIVHVESAAAFTLGDAGLRLNSHFKFTVRQGAISDVAFSLPAGLLVRQIAGLDLGGWEIKGEGEERRLKVFLRRPVSDSTNLQFDLYMAQSFSEQTQPVTMPQFVPQSVTRETGTLGIFAEEQLAVTAGATAGLAQIDVGQFIAPPPLSPPGTTSATQNAPATAPLLAYRFAARPVTAQLLVARQKPQSKGTAEHAVFVGARKLRIASRIELHLAGAPRSEIAVQLPPGYLLYDLKASEAVDYHVDSHSGELRDAQPPGEPRSLLIVELAAPHTGRIELALDGIIAREPEDLAPRVALPAPQGIGEMRSLLGIWLDPIYSATLEDFSGWKSIAPDELPARLKTAQPAAVQFAFTSNVTGMQPVTLTMHQAVPRLSADALSVIIARDTSLQYLLYLRWNITAAGESRFVFTTPDWLADRLEFDRSTAGVRIRQVAFEKVAGNRLRWTVTLDESRTMVSTLLAQATLPPPEAGRIEAPAVTFEQTTAGEGGTQYRALDQQHQYVVLVNQSPQRLERESRDAAEAIPVIDLPIKISSAISDQAAEILRVRDRATPIGWRVQEVQPLKLLPASVNLAKMTLVIARDGSWRGQARYRINNRARQFLALRMPPGSRVLSLFVADRPSRPIDPKLAGEPNVVLAPLPKTAAGDLAVEVQIVYAGRFSRPLPKGVQILRTEIDLPAPQVLSQGEFGIPVAATEWTVILPRDIDAQRIDDSTRTNVSESDEGGEQLIARYNELLNLLTIASDRSLGMSVQRRAQNNLKQLNEELEQYSAVEGRAAAATEDNRQSREIRALKGKLQQVEQQLHTKQLDDSQMAADRSNATNGGFANALSSKAVQRELVAENPDDFQANAPPGDADQIQIGTERSVAEQPAAISLPDTLPAKGAGKSQTSNRRELRKQTASQSMALNSFLVAPADRLETANQSAQNGHPNFNFSSATQNADADEVLEFSNAEAGRQTQQNEQRLGNLKSLPLSQSVVWGRPANGEDPFAQVPGEGVVHFGAVDLPEGAGAILETAAGWTSAGGLSMLIDVPQDGQKLTFSKSGGDARLALGLRPRASLEAVFSLAWTVIWLVVALVLIAALGQSAALVTLARRFPPIAIGLGLAWYFLLPAASLGFAVFVIGAACFGWQHRRA